MTILFYMRGGHVITLKRVKTIELSHDNNGKFVGYKLTFELGDTPAVWRLSPPDIVAVVEAPSWWVRVLRKVRS